jgi:RNA 2',3'-cyclic 3'-phosphodiesterase
MEPHLTRAFICIDLPDAVIKYVAKIQSLIEDKFQGKLTELTNLHLTLKFLGEIDQKTLEISKLSLEKINFSAPDCKINKIGLFSIRKKPRIIWLKIEGKRIFDLQSQIDENLQDLFPKEERFMSHMTIARIKHIKDPQGFKKYIDQMKIPQIQFQINEFKLKSSTLDFIGPSYETLESYK